MIKDKIINIGSKKAKSDVGSILKNAMEFNEKGSVVRALVVFQFNNKNNEECMGIFVGANGDENYTAALAAWDLEHARLGLFDGEFESGLNER